jgi:hypothetical protein
VDDGAVGLSEEDNGVVWEHRVPGSEVFGAVAGHPCASAEFRDAAWAQVIVTAAVTLPEWPA